MKKRSRQEFNQQVKRALAHRVGLLCSNPSCRAATAGPQANPSKAVNVGVAAHITAAARGGPRFDPNMTEKDRRSTVNGIWLCQNCAKLVDNDVVNYSAAVLSAWKAEAEEEARTRIGKTNSRVVTGSLKESVGELKRQQKVRDDLHLALLKSPAERLALQRMASRTAKFSRSEVIIHRIGDRTYPNVDEKPGISGWFKLEILDFYHAGLHCVLDLQYALIDSETRKWSQISYERSQLSFPPRFSKRKIFVTAKIPWRNILHYDLSGDEYYPQPHLYCAFADSGEPYEGRGFFMLGDGYEWELRSEDRMELDNLLQLNQKRAGPHLARS